MQNKKAAKNTYAAISEALKNGTKGFLKVWTKKAQYGTIRT